MAHSTHMARLAIIEHLAHIVYLSHFAHIVHLVHLSLFFFYQVEKTRPVEKNSPAYSVLLGIGNGCHEGIGAAHIASWGRHFAQNIKEMQGFIRVSSFLSSLGTSLPSGS